jgi:hypothetical protein
VARTRRRGCQGRACMRFITITHAVPSTQKSVAAVLEAVPVASYWRCCCLSSGWCRCLADSRIPARQEGGSESDESLASLATVVKRDLIYTS